MDLRKGSFGSQFWKLPSVVSLASGLVVSQHTTADVPGVLLFLWPERKQDPEDGPYALQGHTLNNLKAPHFSPHGKDFTTSWQAMLDTKHF